MFESKLYVFQQHATLETVQNNSFISNHVYISETICRSTFPRLRGKRSWRIFLSLWKGSPTLETDPKDWSSTLVVILMTYSQALALMTEIRDEDDPVGLHGGPAVSRNERGSVKHRVKRLGATLQHAGVRFLVVTERKLRDLTDQGLWLALGSPTILINCWQLAKLSFLSPPPSLFLSILLALCSSRGYACSLAHVAAKRKWYERGPSSASSRFSGRSRELRFEKSFSFFFFF